MNKSYLLTLDPEWMKDKKLPEDNSILRFLGHDFNIDTQRTCVVFELIGNPVEKRRDVIFSKGADEKYHEQVIPENV